jgi:threonylcarbamoyladenosine tRNA methylthiotransferase MtaB
LRDAVPHAGLGADVIVGFPGETSRRFDETFEFIAASPLSYLHVFSWSPRPGTPAAELPNRVAPRVVRERSEKLRGLADDLGYAFRKRFEEQCLDAVVLAPRASDGRVRALTGNFIEVSMDPGSAARGDLPRVRVERVTHDETRASVEGTPPWAVLPATA